MTILATGIADFGVESSAGFVVVELDETLNIDDVGEEKTSFLSEEAVWFWVQHEASLTIDRVACTDPQAMISDHGTTRRVRVADLVFTGEDDVELPYIPAVTPQFIWQGNIGIDVVRDGRTVTVGGNLPCACEVTIPLDVRLFCLQPGHSAAKIVVYLKEAE